MIHSQIHPLNRKTKEIIKETTIYLPMTQSETNKKIRKKQSILWEIPIQIKMIQSSKNKKLTKIKSKIQRQKPPGPKYYKASSKITIFQKNLWISKLLILAQPFGSYGLKIQDQIKGIAVRDSKIKVQQKNKEPAERTTISIKSYLKAIQLMKKQLQQKWAQQDKVACLQIAIQACKLLHDTSNAKFHALKFAYVMQIVDRFGILVFQRIKKLAFPHLYGQKLQQINIKSLQQANIPQSAQQICRNWLLKIASIRQLIPRTIIQTTLLRLHFFINGGIKGRGAFQRLYKSNRCFAQNLNCLFFCTFLVRIGKEVLPQEKNYIIELLEDVFYYMRQGNAKFGRQDVSYDQYFNIVEPFFITSFQSLAQNLQKQKFKKFFSSTIMTTNPHFIILKNLIQAFSPSLLVIYSCDLVKLIQKTPQDHKFILYKALLTQIRSMIFNQSGEFIVLVWTDINQLNDLQTLLDILGPFSEIIFRNLPSYQKNKFYGLILDKFSNMFQNFGERTLNSKRLQKFQLFLSSIIQRTEDIRDIITLEPFLQLISYFPLKSKQQISYNIIKSFVKKDLAKIKDHVVVHIMLSLMKNVSGYKVGKVNADKQVEDLILKFIDKVDFQGKQLEEFLTFYSQIRASFGYLEKVVTTIIYKAAGLTYRARKNAKGKVTNKLISFLQAAVAFCYITVPVLERPQLKLKLYIYLCEVALTNNLISQATSFIKTCITQLAQIQLKTDVQLYEIFFRIISLMIVIPDDPEKDFLFLFNGLFQAFEVSKFKSNHQNIVKFRFYSNCISYLSCQAQQKLPFHIQGVTSNDGLYKSVQFKQALIQKMYQIFQKMQKTLALLEKVSTTDQAYDFYVIVNLPEQLMRIVDIFEEGQRIKQLLLKGTKLLSQVKDRSLRKQNPTNVLRIKRVVEGYNGKLKQNGFGQIKII